VGGTNPAISGFDASCFDGKYITGDISAEYLAAVEGNRCAGGSSETSSSRQLDLNLSGERHAG